MNSKMIALLLGLLVAVSATGTQTPQLQAYCNYLATQNNRYALQYSADISSQRCSFCQYQSTLNFASGCSVCPNYANGTCQNCAPQYVATQAQVCIPCAAGSATCCTGNNATTDPNFTNSINAASTTNSKQALTYTALVQYTGVRQVTCQEGYFAAGHTCLLIPKGCATMNVQNTYYYCQTCQAGFYLDETNNCVAKCQALYTDAKAVANCGQCVSASTCSSCTGAYYLSPTTSTSETVNSVPTSSTLQTCSPCMANCAQCSNGIQTCTKCADKFFYDAANKQCTQCNNPNATLVSLNGLADSSGFFTACSDNNQTPNSYTWTTSIPSGTDTIGLPVNRPIVKLANNILTVCDVNCTACTVNGQNTVCTACQNGYYLNQSNPATPTCTICPQNTSLCVWNTVLTSAQNPQILACTVNDVITDFTLPYSTASFLQLSFTTANFGENYVNYNNSKVCVTNTNNCKEMVDAPSGLTTPGLCSLCYQASDYPVGISATSTAITYTLTPGQTCVACSSLPGAATCQVHPTINTQLVPATCGAGYKPAPVANACQACPIANCTTCDNTGACLTCETSTYAIINANNVITSCADIVYADPTNVQAGCTNWGSGQTQPGFPSCTQCAPGFALVQGVSVTPAAGAPGTANLCMACPANCTQCSATNRVICTACSSGHYLKNGNCLAFPKGCATFNQNGPNGGVCSYCQYGFRLVNDQVCSLCVGSGLSYTGAQWFDCPGAQCASGSSDDPTSSSTNSTILSIISLSLLVISLLI